MCLVCWISIREVLSRVERLVYSFMDDGEFDMKSMYCENCEDNVKRTNELSGLIADHMKDKAELKDHWVACQYTVTQLKKELDEWRHKYAYARIILEKVQDLPGVREKLKEEYRNEWRGIYNLPSGD